VDLFTGAPSYQVFAGGVTISHTLGLTNTFLGAGSATTRDLSQANPMSQQAVTAAIGAVPGVNALRYVIPYTAYQPNGLAFGYYNMVELPAGSILLGAGVYATVEFNGAPVASATARITLDSSINISNAQPVFSGDGVGIESHAAPCPVVDPVTGLPIFTAPATAAGARMIQVGLDVAGGVINDLTAGELVGWVAYV
jgi:hypothetical protein